MTLAFGSTYGGSTAVYTGTSLVPPEHVLQRWNVPNCTFANVEQRARKFMTENNVHFLEDKWINVRWNTGFSYPLHPCHALLLSVQRSSGFSDHSGGSHGTEGKHSPCWENGCTMAPVFGVSKETRN